MPTCILTHTDIAEQQNMMNPQTKMMKILSISTEEMGVYILRNVGHKHFVQKKLIMYITLYT